MTTLQDYRIESGKPSGELKITEVPELPGKEVTQVMEKKDNYNRVLEGLQFFTEKSRNRQ